MTIDQTLSAAVEAMSRGALSEAEAHCRLVLDMDPKHFFATVILGDVLSRTGRMSEAFSAYESAIAINPAHPLAFSRAAAMRFRAVFGPPRQP